MGGVSTHTLVDSYEREDWLYYPAHNLYYALYTLQNMNEMSIIGSAANFICDSFKLKSKADIPEFKNKKEQDVWLGSFAGFMEGIAILVKSEDKQLYERLLDSLERVSLR